ncbi:MAG TPA: hypothetical protein VE861_11485 [Gemmatimonadaceae bacterium]|nr:hypothetical protein [Gemmatimonadaceae bacterium]
MDALSIHLMVNHIPVLAVLAGTFFVLLATFVARRTLWQLGTGAIVLAALSFYPVQWTGENAEDLDMKRWYVQHDAIEEHEEASEKALWVVVLAGAAAAYGFWRATRATPSTADIVPAWLRGAVVVTALAASAATVKTAYEAGFISHKNPLLDRAVVPPADSVPARPVRGGQPPE